VSPFGLVNGHHRRRYREPVEAAASWQVAIIDPSKLRDPKEGALPELLARAAPSAA
jgi:hypothetical protein